MNKKSLILRTLIVFSILFLLFEAQTATLDKSPVERGKYLVTIGGCNDCHTPKIMGADGNPMDDPKRILSGHPHDLPFPTWTPQDMKQRNSLAMVDPSFTAWSGPWGVSFTANLTPDKETGLGEWNEETFIQALRTGKHQGQPNGRDILPPMPWFNYKNLSDDDIKAVWAYLRSLPAVKNQVPTPIPPAGMPEEK